MVRRLLKLRVYSLLPRRSPNSFLLTMYYGVSTGLSASDQLTVY